MQEWIKNLFKQKFRVVPWGNGRYKIQERFLFMWLDEDDYFFNGKTYASKHNAEQAIKILEKS